jgi:uncharacterized protein
VTTYAALGGTFGGVGGAVVEATHWRAFAALLLGLAALSFLAQAIKSAGFRPPFPAVTGLATRFAAPLMPAVERLLSVRRFHLRGYALGVALGLLPCGLLYSALMAAAATGSAAAGALAMVAFAVGTMPALATVGLVGAGALRRWRASLSRIATPLFLFNALLLGGLALRSAF